MTRIEDGRSIGAQGYSKSQLAAVRFSFAIGERLAKQHPEIADIYRTAGAQTRFLEIAEEFIPEVVQKSPDVAMSAVGKALRILVPEEEREQITASLRGERLMIRLGGRNSNTHLEHQRKAARAKKAKGIIPDPANLIEANGFIAWSSAERARLLELSQDPDFQYRKGGKRKVGKLDSSKAAPVLNHEFHNDQPVRHMSSVASQIRMGRKRSYSLNPQG
ncbi:hypothetical protein M1437_03640 [Patescibacteria group bacterium]|nr:hypothetical protein [Patescibacteria group bacterium]